MASAALLAGALATGAALRLWNPERCATPGEADKARLTSFVRLKYNLPPTAEIGLADGGPVFNSCFRKLVFATLSGHAFRAELFASPDFRFLTAELLDARPDTKRAAEERRQTAESLASGNVPARGNENAPVTLAVFSDFQCPFLPHRRATGCGSSFTTFLFRCTTGLVPPLKPRPAHNGTATPISGASRFSVCRRKELSPDNFGARVAGWEGTAAGLDRKEFERCVSQSLTSGQVEQDIALGNELGVGATPTVFLDAEPVDDTSPGSLTW